MYDKVLQKHKNDTIAEKHKYIYVYIYPLQKIWQPIPMITTLRTATATSPQMTWERFSRSWILNSQGLTAFFNLWCKSTEQGVDQFGHDQFLGGRHQLTIWNCESVFLLHQAGGGRHRRRGGRGQERHCRLRRVPRHDDRMMCCHTLPLSKQNKTTGSTCQFFLKLLSW